MLTNMTGWTPWTELAGLHRDLDSMFGRVFGAHGSRQTADGSLVPFTPAADVWSDGDKWQVSLAVPGVSPDKVDIDIVGRTLRVRGEREPARNGEAEPVLSELSYGRFEREFTLPEEIDAKRVHATYRHGMLDLELPLSEGARPHRIKIEAAEDAKRLATA